MAAQSIECKLKEMADAEDDAAPTIEDGEECGEEYGEECGEEYGEEGLPCDDEPDVHPLMGEVFEAAESGDVPTLCSLFEQVDVSTPGEDGDTALHIACLYGQQAAVEECLRRGASVGVKDEDESTPLHDACAGGFGAIVALLLGAKADPAAVDSDGDTPLHHASRGGHADVIAPLIEAGGAMILTMRNASGQVSRSYPHLIPHPLPILTPTNLRPLPSPLRHRWTSPIRTRSKLHSVYRYRYRLI